MKAKLKIPFRLLMLLAAACGPVRIPAQETSFNYQGRLVENGVAATGTYDFIFSVYDAAAGGNILAPAVPVNAVAVNAGQFAVPLDFGAGVFTGAARWLRTGARVQGGAAYTPLAPRQALSPTPYAIFPKTAGSLATMGPAPAPGQFLTCSASPGWSRRGMTCGSASIPKWDPVTSLKAPPICCRKPGFPSLARQFPAMAASCNKFFPTR